MHPLVTATEQGSGRLVQGGHQETHIRGLPRQTVDLPTSDKTASGSQEASGSDVTSNTAFDEADWRGWEPNMSALGESPGHDYDKLTVKPPPIAAPADLLRNVREHVLYYFQHVRQLHFVLANNSVSHILYEVCAFLILCFASSLKKFATADYSSRT